VLNSVLRRPYWPAPPTGTYYAYVGLSSFLYALTFTLSMVYYVKDVGLSPLQMVLVGTVLEAACFLFEIPTGVVADLYSRRLSVIMGLVIVGLAFLLVRRSLRRRSSQRPGKVVDQRVLRSSVPCSSACRPSSVPS
jgi:hypothetical protein